MAGRRTNLALLALLAGALATGALAYAIGSGWVRWAVVPHAVMGIGIVALAPWKSVIARRGLRRSRPGTWASVVLSVLVALALAAGLLHSTGILVTAGPVTAMQLHVGAALASVPLALWHVLRRPVRPRRTDVSRRAMLRAGVLLGGSALAYGAVEGAVRLAGLPGASRRATGSYERGSLDPTRMPVTQWLNDRVPAIDPAGWRLAVATGGDVRTVTYEDLGGFGDRARALLDCTGGWYAEQDWEGVWLDRLVPGAAEARSIVVRSRTGYARRFPARDAGRLLLATRVGGPPLSPGHGFPARLVAPGRRGFWWVKWVTAVEAGDTPWWWQSPFPLT